MSSFYLIGSLRNPEVPLLANYLRANEVSVFDSWYAAGPVADDSWQAYEKEKGLTYEEALAGYAAQHVCEFDKRHLDASVGGILLMPAGKSGHLELGYILGQRKPGYVLFDKEPERWDVMYNLATDVFFDKADLLDTLIAGRVGVYADAR
jgi:hypothetical protein